MRPAGFGVPGYNSEPMKFLERAIQTVSPGWAFSRAQARAAMIFFGYDSANPGPLRGSSGGLGKNASSESPRMQTDTVKVMWDARDVCRNGTLLGGILRRTVRYCFGKLAYKAATGDRGVDKLYQDYFHDWCERADITGRHRLKKLARMGLYSMMRDGNFGFNKVRVPVGNGRQELRLQCVEADRIGNPLEAGTTLYSERYIRGITIDEVGQPVSYRVYKRHRLGIQYTFDQEVPAAQFIHLMDPDETDKYRPPSWLQPALADARDLHEIWGFVKQKCKFASIHSGFFKPTDPYAKAGLGTWDDPGDTATGKPASINAAAGLIRQMPVGMGDIVYPPAMNEPAGAFMNLFETGIRKIAVALDLPYGFVWDMAVFGGATARIETMSANRLFGDKRALMVDRFLEGVKNEVLALGIAQRDIPAHPNFRAGKFHFGSRLTADVGHETSALIQARDSGFTSTTRIAEEWYDEDFDELTQTQAGETQFRQQVAGTTGVPIELLDKVQPNATALLAAINTPPQPPPQPPPGLIGEQGDKGVQPLLDILEAVGEGRMDRESGINAVMELYDLPRAKADAMVPEEGKAEMRNAEGGSRNGSGKGSEE